MRATKGDHSNGANGAGQGPSVFNFGNPEVTGFPVYTTTMGNLYDDSGLDILDIGDDDIATKKAQNMKLKQLSNNRQGPMQARIAGPYDNASEPQKGRRRKTTQY